MAVNEITINGVTQMTVRDTTALAADVDSSKYFYGADGVKTAGTGSGGGGAVSVPRKAVNFIDYDGTVLYAYTAAEFAALAAMPANPTHSGLTAQGWNWTLADAKTYVQKYGALEIGQMYITTDGKTHIDIVLDNPDLLSPYLKIAVNGTATIDWGDNSALDTVTGTSLTAAKYTQHTYAATGAYTIKITVVSGSFTFYNQYILTYSADTNDVSRRYNSSIVAVRLGEHITAIGYMAFGQCVALQTLTIPYGIASIDNNAFQYCYNLQALIIPVGILTIGTQWGYNCYNLQCFVIPNGVTDIAAYALQDCRALHAITIPDTVTSIGNYSFSSDYSLQTVILPDGLTIVRNNILAYGHSLQTLPIPSGATSIGNNAFQNCSSLQSLTIPDGVTSIGSNAFSGCYSLKYIRFEPTTPPTVANSNAFSYVPTDCKIYVPSGTLADYTTETNYPSSGTYTYVEY